MSGIGSARAPLAIALAIAAAACAHPRPTRTSPLAPSRTHVAMPRLAAFAPAAQHGRGDAPLRDDVRPERADPSAAAPTGRHATRTASAPRGSVAVERTAHGGGVSDGAVLAAVRAHEASLHLCFVAARKANPALGDVKIPVHVRIGAKGVVLAATAIGPAPRLDACVADVLRRTRFPASGAPVEIDVPLIFSGS